MDNSSNLDSTFSHKKSINSINLKNTDTKLNNDFNIVLEGNSNKANIRKDNYGNEIKKGSKEHKVCFIDDISNQKIAEVILIESSYLNNGFTECDNFCQCQSCFIF